jgi:hypothetical protein
MPVMPIFFVKLIQERLKINEGRNFREGMTS